VAADLRRLLIVSHGYPPYYGGAEHAAEQMAVQAAATGKWHVDVLTSDIGGRLPAREVAGGVNIIRLPTWKKAWARHTVTELVSFLKAAHSYEQVDRPDLIIAHFSLPGGAVARRLARDFCVPYMVVLHGSDVPHYQNDRFGALYHFTKPWVRSIWRDAKAVIAVSEPLRQLAKACWPHGAIEVISNGVDIERFRPTINRMPPKYPLRLIANAQLIKRKGIHDLLAAIGSLRHADRMNVMLDLCGTGPEEMALRRQAMREGIQDRIHFHGLVEYDQIPLMLGLADIFVLPSTREGMPLALLEAMACGLPGIVSRVGAMPELVCHGESGFVFEPGDVSGLRDAIVKFISDPGLCRTMGAVARVTAVQWSWSMIWDCYEELIHRSGLRLPP
jgi:glycosyltransferase involved in cell wall biosynthesis